MNEQEFKAAHEKTLDALSHLVTALETARMWDAARAKACTQVTRFCEREYLLQVRLAAELLGSIGAQKVA